MTEGSLIAPAAPRFAIARETVATAFVLSAAAHAGVIFWAVSATPTREIAVSAGSPVAIEVELVEGPDAPPAGGRMQRAIESAVRMPDRAVTDDSEPPAQSATPPKTRVASNPNADRSRAADTSFTPAPQPIPVAAHQAQAPAAAAPVTARPQALVPAAPHPPAKPAPPAIASGTIAAAPGPIAALDVKDGTSAAAAAGPRRATASASATAPGVKDGSDGMQGAAPRADNPAPEYPYAARLRGEYGRVLLRVEVLASGDAGKVLVERSSGYDILDQAAVDSVKRWRFRPARRNGEPVTASVRVPIRFALQ
jgi:periplasmic protein TonB